MDPIKHAEILGFAAASRHLAFWILDFQQLDSDNQTLISKVDVQP
jgi:hypothetical protein